MAKIKIHSRAVLPALFLILTVAGGAVLAAQAESKPEDSSQEVLALDYLLLITRTPATDAEAREKLYLALIENCPATQAAEESHWALSNLYLDGFDEPMEKEAKEILEKFLERYPASQWRGHVENRLTALWGK